MGTTYVSSVCVLNRWEWAELAQGMLLPSLWTAEPQTKTLQCTQHYPLSRVRAPLTWKIFFSKFFNYFCLNLIFLCHCYQEPLESYLPFSVIPLCQLNAPLASPPNICALLSIEQPSGSSRFGEGCSGPCVGTQQWLYSLNRSSIWALLGIFSSTQDMTSSIAGSYRSL